MLVLNQESGIRNQETLGKYLLIGALFSMGFLFKVPAAFDFMAAVIFYVFFLSAGIKDTISRIFNKNIWLMVIGFWDRFY